MDLTQRITEIVETVGLPGILVLMFLEMLIPVIQSELVMTFSGFAASRGTLNIYAVAATGIAGSQLGSLFLYAVVRPLSEERVNELLAKYGGWLGFDLEDLERAQDLFRRHDRWAVLIARVVPGLRAIVAIPAGIQRMPFWRFFTFNLLGAGVVISLLTYLGAVLGENHRVVDRYSSWVTFGLAGALALYVLIRIGMTIKKRVSDRG